VASPAVQENHAGSALLPGSLVRMRLLFAALALAVAAAFVAAVAWV
jgi:hypothetical protein